MAKTRCSVWPRQRSEVNEPALATVLDFTSGQCRATLPHRHRDIPKRVRHQNRDRQPGFVTPAVLQFTAKAELDEFPRTIRGPIIGHARISQMTESFVMRVRAALQRLPYSCGWISIGLRFRPAKGSQNHRALLSIQSLSGRLPPASRKPSTRDGFIQCFSIALVTVNDRPGAVALRYQSMMAFSEPQPQHAHDLR